jgi:hypothetical protein
MPTIEMHSRCWPVEDDGSDFAQNRLLALPIAVSFAPWTATISVACAKQSLAILAG